MIFIKLIMAILVAFVAYNFWHRITYSNRFDAVYAFQSRDSMIAQLEPPFESYRCDSGKPSPFSAQNLCANGVQEVDSFETCLVPAICPGWNQVAFNASGQVLHKLKVMP